jgi:hypothetical protein
MALHSHIVRDRNVGIARLQTIPGIRPQVPCDLESRARPKPREPIMHRIHYAQADFLPMGGQSNSVLESTSSPLNRDFSAEPRSNG